MTPLEEPAGGMGVLTLKELTLHAGHSQTPMAAAQFAGKISTLPRWVGKCREKCKGPRPGPGDLYYKSVIHILSELQAVQY